MQYILDSNTFIEAKNRYYSMEICPGFWECILQSNHLGLIYSIDMVKAELEKGNDDLKDWVKNNCQFFRAESDLKTQETYAEIASYIFSLVDFKDSAKEEFLSVADSWLIAKAKADDAILVTHERFNPNTKRKILMPNICKEFDVPFMNTFELLEELKVHFVLKV